MSHETVRRKADWQDSEAFCATLLDCLLRPDSVALAGGTEGWRVLRSAFDRAVLERQDRFEIWQSEEYREISRLREEMAHLDRRIEELRAGLMTREGMTHIDCLIMDQARERGAK